MSPLTIAAISIALSLAVLLVTIFVAGSSLVQPALRMHGILASLSILSIGLLLCVGWIYASFDLIPREWDSSMRANQSQGRFTPSLYVRNAVGGTDYRVSLQRDRNLIFTSASGQVEIVKRSDSEAASLVAMHGGQLLGSVGIADLRETDFWVFTPERVYMFKWGNINGSYWDRRN